MILNRPVPAMPEYVIKLQYGLAVSSISCSAAALPLHYKRQTVPAIINKSSYNTSTTPQNTTSLSMPGASASQGAAMAGLVASDVPIFAIMKHIAQVSE